MSSTAKLGIIIAVALAILFFLSLTFFWPIGITYRHRLQHLAASDVQRVEIAQQRWIDGRPHTIETVTLSDTGTAEFVRLISVAHLMLRNHPRVVGDFPVTIVSHNEVFRFIICATTNQGIYLELGSQGGYGWNYGTIRSDGLGQFLRDIFDHDRPSALVAARR